MSKFNRPVAAPYRDAIVGPVTTDVLSTGSTYEGAPGFARDSKSELFLLAITNFVGEQTFYEKANDRDSRYTQLIKTVAVSDPDWIARFLVWLRTTANMRTASIIGALEAAESMVRAKIPGSRQLVAGVLQRADEPGEALAYWLSAHGRQIPKPIKRGIADAASRLYTQRNWLKWDSSRSSVRFADVIDMCHVKPTVTDAFSEAAQGDLFQYILAHRHNREDLQLPFNLTMLRNNKSLREVAKVNPQALLHSHNLDSAGFTWEDAMSLAGQLEWPNLKTTLWESLIPNMGYMALLRNLRNFSESGISEATKRMVAHRLADVAGVARSRQLPMRFLSAAKAVEAYPHDWAAAIEAGLQHTLQNIAELPGRTLVLVDISGSMDATMSDRSSLKRVEAAAVFGSAIAIRNAGRSTLVAFDTTNQEIPVPVNGSLLRLARQFQARGGTYTARAVKAHYRNHDRVIILTDEQAHDGDPGDVIPPNVPLYTFNLAGYKFGSAAGKPLRYTFGGLTDSCFGMIPLLEAGRSQTWPF